jgi:hypothetical protein
MAVYTQNMFFASELAAAGWEAFELDVGSPKFGVVFFEGSFVMCPLCLLCFADRAASFFEREMVTSLLCLLYLGVLAAGSWLISKVK